MKKTDSLWSLFLKDESIHVRSAAAKSENIDQKTLAIFASADPNYTLVRYTALQNPNLPILSIRENFEALSKINLGYSRDLLRAIARNPSTPRDILSSLSESEAFRYMVSFNPNTPPEVLRKLSNDPDTDIREGVARNPNTPREVLERFFKEIEEENTEHSHWMLISIAQNPRTDRLILTKLASKSDSDMDDEIRVAVAKNQNTPAEILWKLATDPSPKVRGAVVERLSS